MDNIEDYRKILDFIFSGCEVSPELAQQIRVWFGAHGNKREVKEMLMRYWDETSAECDDFDKEEGLERLMEILGLDEAEMPSKDGVSAGRTDNETADSQQVRHSGTPFWKKTVKWTIAAAAGAALFVSGFTASEWLSSGMRETVLVASDESVASFTLPDSTKIWLNRGSRLSYTDSYGTLERKVSLDGEGFFEVTKDASRPFVVKMNNATEVKVLGTSFNALAYRGSDRAEIILKSGSVQVSDSQSNENVILKPDQMYVKENGTTEISHVNAAECCRWYEKRLVFDNMMIHDVLSNLSHKYQMPFILRARNLERKRMSLTVRDESPEEILDVLSFLLPIRWEKVEGPDGRDQIIIRNKPQK